MKMDVHQARILLGLLLQLPHLSSFTSNTKAAERVICKTADFPVAVFVCELVCADSFHNKTTFYQSLHPQLASIRHNQFLFTDTVFPVLTVS